MSMFSGKCDFADTVSIHGADEILRSKIYYKDCIVPLRIDTEKDLVPFYPFIVKCAIHSNGEGSIWLSDESFIDSQEKERLGWYKRDLVKIWRRCKRKKETFVPRDAAEKICGWLTPSKEKEDVVVELANRIAKDGERASIDGLRLPLAEVDRRRWYDEMIRVGYTQFQAVEWIWGWEEAYKQLKGERNAGDDDRA